MKNLSLDRTQLKLIAICSMVIDHIAWGFLDFYTPLAQFMHVLGRLCIPIMCFFVAEGFRKTSNVRKYVYRMATFAAVSAIPFYIFFHNEYGYRQNIIFDYLLGLLLLIALESKKLSKTQKILSAVALFAVSLTVGGWVVGPMLFILAFYYGRDFKEQAKWFCIINVSIVAILVVLISLNSVYHFSHYEWVWWDKFYLLGFMLALPLIRAYNGQKGKIIFNTYFFYMFYPVHFLVLHVLQRLLWKDITVQQVYLGFHVAALALACVLVCLTYRARPSKGQNAISFFMAAATLYILGFVLEIISSTGEAYFICCIIEYIGEFLAMIASLIFVSTMCKRYIPPFVIAIHSVIALLLLYALVTTRETGFFYSYIGVNYDGPFPRLELVHSIGFFLSMAYLAFICIEDMTMCVSTLKSGTKADKKRVRFIIYSTIGAWIPYGLTAAGLTGGYEVPALGLLFVGIFLYLAFVKFGTLDSVVLASENALDHGHEGIVVIDSNYRIQYHNSMVDKVLGDFPHTEDIHDWPVMNEVIEGKRTSYEVNHRIYDFEVESLIENGYEQGKMVWIIDNTDHHYAIMEIEEYANRDPLTGLYNRAHFKEIVDEDVKVGRHGTFLMMDMDNFKQINDLYGHQRGDTVLMSLANILMGYSEDKMYACRVGGDEFCAYLRNMTDKEKVEAVIGEIMASFSKTFRDDGGVKCSISVGAVINDCGRGLTLNCSEMYSLADDKLYEAKNSGKNTYKL